MPLEASQELMEALASRKAVTREAFEALMAQLATAGQAEAGGPSGEGGERKDSEDMRGRGGWGSSEWR